MEPPALDGVLDLDRALVVVDDDEPEPERCVDPLAHTRASIDSLESRIASICSRLSSAMDRDPRLATGLPPFARERRPLNGPGKPTGRES